MSATNNSKNIGEKPVFITQNQEMKNLYQKVKLVARSQAPVFITGESGTGKEVLARLLHYHSPRSNQPFLAINCGALPKSIVESEIFGHEKGSFTGAVNTKRGCFEQADKGILFLDEVAEMTPEIQVKLLRVVELKNFRRIGGSEEIQTDIQIISATNQKVSEKMENDEFREDLFYRLSVIELEIPPLRDRRDDIPLLCEFMLSKYVHQHNLDQKQFSTEFMEYLMNYDWPGNVRELANVVERCSIMCPDSVIHVDHLPKSFGTETNGIAKKNGNGIHSNGIDSNGIDKSLINIPIGTSMVEVEKMMIKQTLTLVNNNKSEAAKILGVSRKTLHNKLSNFSG